MGDKVVSDGIAAFPLPVALGVLLPLLVRVGSPEPFKVDRRGTLCGRRLHGGLFFLFLYLSLFL
jgi:hypothetical protein